MHNTLCFGTGPGWRGGSGFSARVARAERGSIVPRADGSESTCSNGSSKDVAHECQTGVGAKGFGGVQVTPPAGDREGREYWWTVYQPVSLKDFKRMIDRCNVDGVKIYADAVFNQIASGSGSVTGGGSYNSGQFQYPQFGYIDFHHSGDITNYGDSNNVWIGALYGMSDLNTGSAYVQVQIVIYIKILLGWTAITFGTAPFTACRIARCNASGKSMPMPMPSSPGSDSHLHDDPARLVVRRFLLDAAKHMAPSDSYSCDKAGSAMVDLEVWGAPAGESGASGHSLQPFRPVHRLGTIGTVFTAASFNGQFRNLKTKAERLGVSAEIHACTNLGSHDRRPVTGAAGMLTFINGARYEANTFMMAWPYGWKQLMSVYRFADMGKYETDKGAPASTPCPDSQWNSEQRRPQIMNMALFRNRTEGTPVSNWWDNGHNQVAFSRGDTGLRRHQQQRERHAGGLGASGKAGRSYKGFVTINNESGNLVTSIPTCRRESTATSWQAVTITASPTSRSTLEGPILAGCTNTSVPRRDPNSRQPGPLALHQTVLASLFNPALGLQGFQLFHMRSCMHVSTQYVCDLAGGKWARELACDAPAVRWVEGSEGRSWHQGFEILAPKPSRSEARSVPYSRSMPQTIWDWRIAWLWRDSPRPLSTTDKISGAPIPSRFEFH
uniref:Amylase n=1 Tax=Aeromonas hydrophila TaxID=644 RepID=Q44062_AERHY|nr:amylase [Aeromonas hydrophila]